MRFAARNPRRRREGGGGGFIRQFVQILDVLWGHDKGVSHTQGERIDQDENLLRLGHGKADSLAHINLASPARFPEVHFVIAHFFNRREPSPFHHARRKDSCYRLRVKRIANCHPVKQASAITPARIPR